MPCLLSKYLEHTLCQISVRSTFNSISSLQFYCSMNEKDGINSSNKDMHAILCTILPQFFLFKFNPCLNLSLASKRTVIRIFLCRAKESFLVMLLQLHVYLFISMLSFHFCLILNLFFLFYLLHWNFLIYFLLISSRANPYCQCFFKQKNSVSEL